MEHVYHAINNITITTIQSPNAIQQAICEPSFVEQKHTEPLANFVLFKYMQLGLAYSLYIFIAPEKHCFILQ